VPWRRRQVGRLLALVCLADLEHETVHKHGVPGSEVEVEVVKRTAGREVATPPHCQNDQVQRSGQPA
jgi:hypothetical protein